MSAASPISFNIGDLLSRSWKALMANAAVLIVGIVIIAVINIAVAAILRRFAVIGTTIIGGPLALGYCAISLAAARNQIADFGKLFSGFQRFVPALMANIVITSPSIVNWVFSFLPLGPLHILTTIIFGVAGIVFGFVFMLTYYYMSDRNLDFMPALMSSKATIMASLGSWLVLFIVGVGLFIAGVISCGIGLLITVPLAAVMFAMAYDQATATA